MERAVPGIVCGFTEIASSLRTFLFSELVFSPSKMTAQFIVQSTAFDAHIGGQRSFELTSRHQSACPEYKYKMHPAGKRLPQYPHRLKLWWRAAKVPLGM
jgi:hypothetical protein